MTAQFEQAWQTLCAAITWQQAQAHFRLTKSRQWLGDANMTGERELHTTTERNAIDRSDRRLFHGFDFAKSQMGVVR